MEYIKIYYDFIETMKVLGYAERGRLFTGMLNYASTGEDPQFSGNERIIWPVIKAQIDRDKLDFEKTSSKRAAAGKKGGRPRKEEKANESYEKQKKQLLFQEIEREKEKEEKERSKEKEEKEKEKDKEFPPLGGPPHRWTGCKSLALIDDSDLSEKIKRKLADWVEYRGDYAEISARTLILKIDKTVKSYGEEAVIDLIDNCIANGYKGLFFDRIERSKKTDDGFKSFEPTEFFEKAVSRSKEILKGDFKHD